MTATHGLEKLPKRFLDRAVLLGTWATRVVFPRYWKPIIGAMILRTAGALSEAASFVVAVQLLIHWSTVEKNIPNILDSPLLAGGAVLVALLIAGTLCSYLGELISIRTTVDFETAAFVQAVAFVSSLKRGNVQLSRTEEKDLFFNAPRFMGRTILQCIGVGSSIVLAFVGAAVCANTFPALSGILGIICILSSPAYIYHALHSNNIGHRFRHTAPEYGRSKKNLYRKWVDAEEFDLSELERDAQGDAGYISFLDVYGQRLAISPMSRLIVNGTMALSILVSLIWMGANLQFDSETIPHLVVYLVFVRVFFSGVKGIMNSVQIIASFVPNYLLYLNLDPRMKDKKKQRGDA